MSTPLKKMVAKGMLLYALLCFAAPDTCRGDDAISTPLGSTGPVQEQVLITDNTAPSRSQALDQDDCFCCCSHIVPSSATVEFVMFEGVSASPVSMPSYSQLLADPFFHPPRV
jgi:hypothetical protein